MSGVSVISVRQPKQVLHFSDGILEIFDDDEESKPETKEDEVLEVNEKELSWTPWFIYKAQRMGQNFLSGLDYTGEKLADFLNITTPKYAYEIQQYKKELARKAMEEEIAKENTWKVQPDSPGNEPITKPPTQTTDMKF